MFDIAKRILIVCEDEKSAKFYFESFKKDEKLRRGLASVDIEVIHPKDHSPVGLVNKAKEKKKKASRERNPYNEVWIVTDKDNHANIDSAIEIANDSNIKVALSVICFEYWILLHFEKTTRHFSKCDEVIYHIRKKHWKDYEKNTDSYFYLQARIHTAIKNGEWLLKQNQNDIDRGIKITQLSAYTNVHLLVKKLINPRKYLF